MIGITAQQAREAVDVVYRSDSRRILATLIRLLGDFDLAEEALSDAFAAALQQWPRDGVPANPRAWLVSAGRFKAIDTLRRRARFDTSVARLAQDLPLDKLDAMTEEVPLSEIADLAPKILAGAVRGRTVIDVGR